MRQSDDDTSTFSDQPAPAGTPKRPWATPAVRELPKLTDLTLQTDGIPGGGGTGGGGSTVF